MIETTETRVVTIEDRHVLVREVADMQVVFGGEQGPSGISEEAMAYSKRTDFVGTATIYAGEADPGTLDSQPLWRIKRITLASDDDTRIEWAAGAAFTQVWNDRLVLVYV